MTTIQQAFVDKATHLEAVINNARVSAEHDNCACLFENPLRTVDKIAAYSPFHGFTAMSSVCNSLGWYVVNALAWEYRITNKRETTSDIDIFADGLNDQDAEIQTSLNTVETGHAVLPKVNGMFFVAAYKGLLGSLRGYTNFDLSRLPLPNLIYNQMMAGNKNNALNIALDEYMQKLVSQSTAHADINKSLSRRREKQADRSEATEKLELEHIMLSLQTSHRDSFNDGTWAMLPIWAQYKICFNIRQQVIEALTSEMRKQPAERKHEFDLMELLDECDLELRSASSNAEIKLAFEQGKLDAAKHTVM